MNVFYELLISFLPGQTGCLFMWALLAIAVMAVITILERWIDIKRRTDVDGEALTGKVRSMLRENKYKEAYGLCGAGGRRALARVLGAGIKKALETPEMIRSGMEEESLHLIPILERRINLLPMYGNASTLLGLMGTIYGLILAFDAVGRPGVDPVQKSSMLAMGISAAMNTTLLGLIIAIPCIIFFSYLRGRLDEAIGEIDRYAVSTLKVLVPQDVVQKEYKVTAKRIKDDVETEINIAPMMNLMVILIPLLLSSAEFVKMGEIELKLPESAQGGEGEGMREGAGRPVSLDLGIVITARGFSLFHYFKNEPAGGAGAGGEPRAADIPKKNGVYDFKKLNEELAGIKCKALGQLLRSGGVSMNEKTPLAELAAMYASKDMSGVEAFSDHENIKVVAEDTISYETVVAVMDAARAISTAEGKVGLFPNVSLAGGIVP